MKKLHLHTTRIKRKYILKGLDVFIVVVAFFFTIPNLQAQTSFNRDYEIRKEYTGKPINGKIYRYNYSVSVKEVGTDKELMGEGCQRETFRQIAMHSNNLIDRTSGNNYFLPEYYNGGNPFILSNNEAPNLVLQEGKRYKVTCTATTDFEGGIAAQRSAEHLDSNCDSDGRRDAFNSSFLHVNYSTIEGGFEVSFEFEAQKTICKSDLSQWYGNGIILPSFGLGDGNTFSFNGYVSYVLHYVTEGSWNGQDIDVKSTTRTPDIPYLVLHDPPGDGSFASWTKDQKICRTVVSEFGFGSNAEVYGTVKVGVEQSSGVLGVAEVTTSVYAQVSGSVSAEFSRSSGDEVEECHTTSETFSTSEENNKIVGGHRETVYFGKSTLYKLGIGLASSYTCKNKTKPNFNKKILVKAVAKDGVQSFAHTESHIKEVLIPEWEEDSKLKKSEDSTKRFNAVQNLKIWRQVFEQQEETLNNGKIVETLTFDGGSGNIEKSLETETTKISTMTYELGGTETVAAEMGLEVAGSGFTAGASLSLTQTYNTSTSDLESSTNTISYTLADDDDSDEFNIEVLNDEAYGVPAFRLVEKKSKTSCPYEGGIQLDQPGLKFDDGSIEKSFKGRIGEKIDIKIQMCNDSDEDRSYFLNVENNSNLSGLKFEVTGTDLNSIDKGHEFEFQAKECKTAILIIEQPADQVKDFNGVKIHLNPCEEEENIQATITLNVLFE